MEIKIKVGKALTGETRVDVEAVEMRINGIVGLRGVKRKTAVDIAKDNLYNYLKLLNYKEVTRGFLKSFFSDDINPRTRKRVLRVIINELKKEGKIKEEIIIKTITFFRNCPLYSQDYGSYSLMMKKNRNKPKELQGVYSMSSLSIRKVTQPFKMKAYTIL